MFLREIFSPAAGFLWGWAMFWSMHTGIIAAIAMVFARYAAYFVPLGDIGTAPRRGRRASSCCRPINYVGVRHGSRVQTAFTVRRRSLAVVAIIVVGLLLDAGDAVGAAGDGARRRSSRGGLLLRASVAGLFAFGGWHMVTYTAEETDDPAAHDPARADDRHRSSSRSCYIGLNAVYLACCRSTRDRVDARRRRRADALVRALAAAARDLRPGHGLRRSAR